MLLPSSEGIAQYLEAQESFVKVLRSINNVAAAASDDTPWAAFVVFVDFMFKTNASIHSDNSFSHEQHHLSLKWRSIVPFKTNRGILEGIWSSSINSLKGIQHNSESLWGTMVEKNKSLILQHGAKYSKIRKTRLFGKKKSCQKPYKGALLKSKNILRAKAVFNVFWALWEATSCLVYFHSRWSLLWVPFEKDYYSE